MEAVFEIIGYSNLRGTGQRFISSSTFSIGGSDTWCIRFYPNGNNKDDYYDAYVAVYLVYTGVFRMQVSCVFSLVDWTTRLSTPPLKKDETEVKRSKVEFIKEKSNFLRLWVDGEKIMSAEEPPEVTQARNDNSHGTNFPDSPEPIYGTQYLPRKFKIAVTTAGDNSVDILSIMSRRNCWL
ncbi:hypothetical protein PR202_ga27631 [Eleusine coracana subsp. coracana]|uniref:MATH domain-containing protein n=1 Tax=Eleusine coracana subsp. coracana TaxID=191504 RepID=A0AAV5DI55_ELECO|nr:hypothetical protein PR202_ga27631 [Eleusine coracana subsp. coracana]